MTEPSPFAPPSRPSQVTLKTAYTTCFAVASSVALILFLFRVREALLLCVSGALIAVALDHVVVILEQRFKLKRWLGILIVVVAAMGLLVGLGLILVPPAVRQGRTLVQQGPELLQHFKNSNEFRFLDKRLGISERLKDLASQPESLSGSALLPALAAVGSALSGTVTFVTLFFLAIFMLVFGGGQVKALLSEAHPFFRDRYERVLTKTYSAVGGYIGGLLVICGINATLTTTFLALVPRLPYFLPLGILAGASSLVPYAGPIVSGVLVTGIAFISGGWVMGLITAGYFVLYGQLEGNIIGPVIFRRTVHLNPLVTLLSILFLAEFMGVLGAILAVPAMAAAQIIVRELLSMRRERWQKDERVLVQADSPLHADPVSVVRT